MTRKLPHVGLGSIPDAEPMRSTVRGVSYGTLRGSIRVSQVTREPDGSTTVVVESVNPYDAREREPIRVDATVGKAIREIEQSGEVI